MNRGVEVIFEQAATGGSIDGTEGVTHEEINFYDFNAIGHYSGSCPSTDKRTNGVISLQVGAYFAQCFPSTEDIIDPKWIILD